MIKVKKKKSIMGLDKLNRERAYQVVGVRRLNHVFFFFRTCDIAPSSLAGLCTSAKPRAASF